MISYTYQAKFCRTTPGLGFGLKEEAVRALADNRSNPQFPGLGVAPCSRG